MFQSKEVIFKSYCYSFHFFCNLRSRVHRSSFQEATNDDRLGFYETIAYSQRVLNFLVYDKMRDHDHIMRTCLYVVCFTTLNKFCWS